VPGPSGVDGAKEYRVIDHVRKTITTRDGVRLAVRDYGSVATAGCWSNSLRLSTH
jgi:hypothetical protein